jgi:hypothetical protein
MSSTDGPKKTNSNQQVGTINKKFREFLSRYRVPVSATFAVLATLAFIAGQIFPKVNQFVFQSGILQYVTFLVVLDLSIAIYLFQAPAISRLSKNQDESMQDLIRAVPRCRAEGADLLEYAGATILPLIRAIQREGVPIRMLVRHPDTVLGLQRQRMIATLDTLFNSIFEGGRGSCEVRCYRAPFALRGRRLGGELLEIGWITPDLKRDTAYGHANPSVIADLTTRNNQYLWEFFDRTFKELWDAPDTEDGRVVLARLQPAALSSH